MSKNDNKKGKASITTSEIARCCGLSRPTVSAVLNGTRKVRESTRRKVLDFIREHDYQVGMISKALVNELSYMVAVLASDLSNPFQMMMFRGISEVLDAHGYHILVHNVKTEDKSDPKTLASLRALRPAGYIIPRGSEGLNGEHARQILDNGLPLVTQGQLEGIETHSINFDNASAMKLATNYALEMGHRRLGYVAGPTFSQGAQQRKMGFLESLVEHGIPVTDAIIVDSGEAPNSGYQAALDLLKSADPLPTVLLCFNDAVAAGVYRAAHDLSLEVPDDLSIIGFDGAEFGDLLAPPLTTVDILPIELGKKAAELLVRVIKDEVGRDFETQWVIPRLLERKSVRQIGPPIKRPTIPKEAGSSKGVASMVETT